MGLLNSVVVFAPKAIASLKYSAESAMKVSVIIYDPNVTSVTWNATSGVLTTSGTTAYTGKARIIPISNPNLLNQQRVLVQIPLTSGIRKGMVASYAGELLTVQSVLPSSNPLTTNMECSVNNGYASN